VQSQSVCSCLMMVMWEKFVFFFMGHESVDYVTTFCLHVYHLVAGSILKITKHLTFWLTLVGMCLLYVTGMIM